MSGKQLLQMGLFAHKMTVFSYLCYLGEKKKKCLLATQTQLGCWECMQAASLKWGHEELWHHCFYFSERLYSVRSNVSEAQRPADVSLISPSSFSSPCFPTAILHNVAYSSCNISSFPHSSNSLPCPLFPPAPQCSPCLLPNLLGLPVGQESTDAGPEVDVW